MTWIERLSQRQPQLLGNVDMKQTATPKSDTKVECLGLQSARMLSVCIGRS
jgi:hypothetical protein